MKPLFAFALVSAAVATPRCRRHHGANRLRNWFLVNTMASIRRSPLFESIGGMHIVHVNSVGEAALKKGGPYPDGTICVTDRA